MRTGIASLLVLAAWLTPTLAAGTIYVNAVTGDDAWDGLCATWDGGICGPKRTIQAGIDLAVPGDEVILAPVTYTGDGNRDVDFLGKAITVRSEDPNDPNVVAATVIDCQANEPHPHRGFNFLTGERRDSVLAGITVEGGWAPGACWLGFPDAFSFGGAVLCGGTSPTIRVCVLTRNQGGWGAALLSYGVCLDPNAGGSPLISGCTFDSNFGNPADFGCALDFTGGAPEIENSRFVANTGGFGALGFTSVTGALVIDCEIVDNSSFGWGPDWGGGGVMINESDVSLVGCEIARNSVGLLGQIRGLGGGLFVRGPAHVTLVGCEIRENRANAPEPLGAAVYCRDTQLFLSGCTVTGNSAVGDNSAGGAICATGASDIALTNCVITGNQAVYGGALATVWGEQTWSGLTITNCTITGNRAATGAVMGWQFGTANILNSIVWNGPDWLGSDLFGGIHYSNVEGGWPDVGNIDVNPLFVDAGHWDDNGTPNDPNDDVWVDGDYQLRPGSACIDAGNNDAVPADVTSDLAGNPRRADDPATPDTGFGTPPLVDMGAYEYMPLGDVNCDGVINFDDINAFVLALSDPDAYAVAFPNCDLRKADCNGDGVVNFDDINAFVAILSGE